MSKPKNIDKPKIAITIGDINGIGPEVIIKAFGDSRMLALCTPVIYGSSKALNYYRKGIEVEEFNPQIAKYINDDLQLNPKVVNVVNCWDEAFDIEPGAATESAGKYALTAIDDALEDLKKGYVDAIVTAPINKSVVKPEGFNFTGHTEYITQKTDTEESVMMLVSDNFRMALATNHLPLGEVSAAITKEGILKKLRIVHKTLERDMGILNPKIAVFGLNPHAGDNGLLGKEEKEIIIPAIEKAKQDGIMAVGPFPADGFMGAASYKHFDAILAMYHDQGLVAFKSVSFGNGVNYTAGLPIVRTSPDHGTAYDLASKGQASAGSLQQAVFLALDVLRNRAVYDKDSANPVKRRSIRGREN